MGGRNHARILAQNPNCDLVAVADKDPDRVQKVAEQWKAQAFTDYEDLIRDRLVDAVVIAVPTSLHHEVATKFLQNGIHCLVEKPITVTVDEAEDLIRIAREKNCVLQVGHVERYNAAIRRLRDEVLDNPGFVECHRLGPFTSRVADVGVVLDLMIHDIDIVLQIVDSPIVWIDAVGVSILTDKEDFANARIKFESGCTANLTVSRVTPKVLRKIRIFQRDTYVSINYVKQSMQLHRRVARPGAKAGEPNADIVVKRLRLKKEDMLSLELDDFIRASTLGGDPTVTGQHARDALETAVKIAKMIEERQHEGVFQFSKSQ